MSKPKIQMPGAARAGIALLVVGGLIVGLGTYYDKGGVSLYGLGMVVGGFILYLGSSIRAKRKGQLR
ncbi:MAG TPA: hypothetical protein VHA09_04940 [Nitrososphaera sp.]|nr:hypothetical protein [Nitrososphaera sp.]